MTTPSQGDIFLGGPVTWHTPIRMRIEGVQSVASLFQGSSIGSSPTLAESFYLKT